MKPRLLATFAALKFRLVRNGLKKQRNRMLMIILMPLFGITVIGPVFGFLAGANHHPDDAYATAVVAFGAIFAGWVVLPILGFGSDETLDPANLALLPLTAQQLAGGLLVASTIGPAPIGTFIALSGALGGYSGGRAIGYVIVLLAVIVMLAACLIGSRVFVTVLSGLLRSRRGRDIGVTVGAMLGVGIQLLRFVLVDDQGRFRAKKLHAVIPYVAWTPPGLVARAVNNMRLDRPGYALLALAVAVGQLALLAWLWVTVLERVLTTAETTTQRVDVNASNGVFPGLLRFLPRTRTGAVAMKELRYLARDPRRRAAIIPSVVLPLIPILSVLRAGGSNPKLVVAAAFTTLLGGIAVFNNQFGTDGPAYWLHVAVDGDARADITGKNVAALALGVPIPIAAGAILAFVTGGWAYLPYTIVISIGVFGVLLGVGDVVSVRFPQPLPESRSNMWAARSGQGCAMAFISLLVLAGEAILLAPVAIATFLSMTSHPSLRVAVATGTVLYGFAMWTIGRQMASTWLQAHQPEMLTLLTPKQA